MVLAEDHYLVREGTRRLLEDGGEVTVLAAVGNARELLDAVERLDPDAVITDIRMPPDHHMEGIVAARAIRHAHPDIGVLVLSQHADEVVISLHAANGRLDVAVVDNGIGFDADAVDSGGLENLRDRVWALGGSLRVDSGDGGTRLQASIPINAAGPSVA